MHTIMSRLNLFTLLVVANVFGATIGQQNFISLADTWRFRLDPGNVGIEKNGSPKSWTIR